MKRTTTRQTAGSAGRRGLLATAAAALTLGALAMPAAVDAGSAPPTADVDIHLTVLDPEGNASAVLDAMSIELFIEPDGANIAGSDGELCGKVAASDPATFSTRAWISISCSIPSGTSYRLGNGNPPAGFSAVSAECSTDLRPAERIPGEDTVFELGSEGAICELIIFPTPTMYIDTVLDGGDAASADVQIEVYDDNGTQIDIGTVSDPADATCTYTTDLGGGSDLTDEENCLAVPLDPGTYALGGVLPDYGYAFDELDCHLIIPAAQNSERFDDNGVDDVINHAALNYADSYCIVRLDYETTTVLADIVVVNDSGRSADGSEFTIEVFNNNGDLVDSGPDPEPGIGNASAEFELPIGPYTMGVSGPDGYEGSVEIIAVGSTEQIPGDDATFTLGSQTLLATITVDDQTIVTTTSTTTTTTTSTPTTLAPTTASTVDPNAVLPATGSSNTTTWTMLLIALGCLGAGGLTVAGARRR